MCVQDCMNYFEIFLKILPQKDSIDNNAKIIGKLATMIKIFL